MPPVQHPSTTTTAAALARKRRASKACSCCRSRKVRCDVVRTGSPCTKCRVDGFDCDVPERKKRCTRAEARSSSSQILLHYLEDSANQQHNGGVAYDAVLPRISLPHITQYPFFRSLTSLRDQSWPTPREPSNEASSPATSHNASEEHYAGGMSAEDIKFLKQKGAFTVPPRKIMDELVHNYFRTFHPFFPIVDRPRFLKAYHAMDDKGRGGPSLILLQAIIFTSSASIPWKALSQLQFDSRHHARSIFHRRIRYLYEFDCEKDTTINIQALLLMSHYYPSMTDQKHTWFWIQQAIGLAQGVGLHKDPGPVGQRSHWARIWWACLCRDRLTALGTGRPRLINSSDCSVAMLTPADLEEEGDCEDDSRVKVMYIEFVKLCHHTENVLLLTNTENISLESLFQRTSECENILRAWENDLSACAQRLESGGPEYDVRGISAMYRTVLHMMYNLVMITLSQSYQALGEGRPNTTQPPLPRVHAMAKDTAQLALSLSDADMVKVCPTICVTAILPAVIVHLLEWRFHESLVKPVDKSHYDSCMSFLKQLSDIYWHASFYHRIFELAESSCQLIDLSKTPSGPDPIVAFLKESVPRKFDKPLDAQLGNDAPGVSMGGMERELQAPNGDAVVAAAGTENPYYLLDGIGEKVFAENTVGDIEFPEFSAAQFDDWLNGFGFFFSSFPSA